MTSQDAEEQEIIRSWHSNAAPWARAIRAASIASRKFVTNQAIIDAVSSVPCARILDIGCGEGWLTRALSDRGMSVTGIDVVPELIAQAGANPRATAPGSMSFHVQDYASIANRQWHGGPFDAAVCNFSLLGRESYQDGWREGSWLGFSGDFNNPAHWYFRTLETWTALLQRCGFDILECREPTAAGAVTPASVIWIGKPRHSAQT